MGILYDMWILNSLLFFRSDPNYMPLKHQDVVWVRAESVTPKRNSGLMTYCYVSLRQMLIVPQCDNRSWFYCWNVILIEIVLKNAGLFTLLEEMH